MYIGVGEREGKREDEGKCGWIIEGDDDDVRGERVERLQEEEKGVRVAERKSVLHKLGIREGRGRGEGKNGKVRVKGSG